MESETMDGGYLLTSLGYIGKNCLYFLTSSALLSFFPKPNQPKGNKCLQLLSSLPVTSVLNPVSFLRPHLTWSSRSIQRNSSLPLPWNTFFFNLFSRTLTHSSFFLLSFKVPPEFPFLPDFLNAGVSPSSSVGSFLSAQCSSLLLSAYTVLIPLMISASPMALNISYTLTPKFLFSSLGNP